MTRDDPMHLDRRRRTGRKPGPRPRARWTGVLPAAALLLLACGGSPTAPEPDCAAGSAWDGSACVAWGTRTALRVPTPWVEGGQAVSLETIVYTPLTPGPWPTLVFHHGSTGNGDDPSLFALTWESEILASALVEEGWRVLFPQRRGRGGSGGLYDEGFTADRSRYACDAPRALAGLERALADADVVTAFVLGMADVDGGRLLVGGISRGGILATAHAARRPEAYRSVVNFVGGWLGEGCVDAVPVNRGTFAAAGATAGGGSAAPVLWLYGENDPFYGAAHSRANFDAFLAGGGTGTFHLYRRANGANGHFIINEPLLWREALEPWLEEGPSPRSSVRGP